jgi:REP element-mobilizing transposase RayT
MPRPPRIDYEGAFHHVMNRGRARQVIFHSEIYFEAFLKTLEEAYERFDAIIHGYCLMSNHYHLIIETPKANLSRIMRHINGVYTQRYNRLKNSDGPLFRGRYRAILVDEDAYLLQLSRYIHRNPIETRKPMVEDLVDYPWSSYSAYINHSPCPHWLYRDKVYRMLGKKQKYSGYATYVGEGIDEDIERFYNKGNILSVLGNMAFRESARVQFEETDLEVLRAGLQDRPSADELIKLVSQIAKVRVSDLVTKPVGRRPSNDMRAFAMYACQYYGNCSLSEIAQAFGLSHTGSASFSINKIKKVVGCGEWDKIIKMIEKKLYIVK